MDKVDFPPKLPDGFAVLHDEGIHTFNTASVVIARANGFEYEIKINDGSLLIIKRKEADDSILFKKLIQ